MKRWLLQVLFGVVCGIAANAALPGHHPMAYSTAGTWSLMGAMAGGSLAPVMLPRELLRPGGFVVAWIGAIAALLVQALLVA